MRFFVAGVGPSSRNGRDRLAFDPGERGADMPLDGFLAAGLQLAWVRCVFVRVLDLYQGEWEGKPLSKADCILSTDQKSRIQARRRIHSTLPPAPARPMRVEHEYERRGAWAYLAAGMFDVPRCLAAAKRKLGCVPSVASSPRS
jgi:hypothetical protein